MSLSLIEGIDARHVTYLRIPRRSNKGAKDPNMSDNIQTRWIRTLYAVMNCVQHDAFPRLLT
jgi:hypothetical protein